MTADQTEPKPAWRLLTRADIIQAGDEGLNDDCETWHSVSRLFQRMPYNPGFFVPIRRRIEAQEPARVSTAAEMRRAAAHDSSCVGAFARARP